MYNNCEEFLGKLPRSPTYNHYKQGKGLGIAFTKPSFDNSNTLLGPKTGSESRPTFRGSLPKKNDTLNFSRRSSSRQTPLNSRETTARSRPSLYIHPPKYLFQNDIPQGTEHDLCESETDNLKKQNQQLKIQHRLLLSHLQASRRALDNLNQAYEGKCQELLTLKTTIENANQIVLRKNEGSPNTSFGCNEVLKYRRATNYGFIDHAANKEPQNSRPNSGGLNIICRRVSIKENIPDTVFGSQQGIKPPLKMDEYVRKKLVESIKGSAYDVISSKLI